MPELTKFTGSASTTIRLHSPRHSSDHCLSARCEIMTAHKPRTGGECAENVGPNARGSCRSWAPVPLSKCLEMYTQVVATSRKRHWAIYHMTQRKNYKVQTIDATHIQYTCCHS
jgi:hypothetical protein